MQEKGEKSPLSLTNRGIRSTFSRSSADWVQKVVPFRRGITDMPMSATKSFLPPVFWMTRKKIIFYL